MPSFSPTQAHSDPFMRFQAAFAQASTSEDFDATRAALATSKADGGVAVRFVLIRDFDETGFFVYTHYESPKAVQLEQSGRAALAWHWSSTGRQVRVEGRVERATNERSDRYFANRARGSQIGAWASPQSTVISGTEEIASRVAEVEARFEGKPVTRPDFWGGYQLIPDRFEFWLNGEHRLHDRELYLPTNDGWAVQKLAP